MSVNCKHKELVIKFIMLGMLQSYKNGFINFDYVHFSLFAPKGVSLMKENGLEDITDFIETGMELEDIYQFGGEDSFNKEISKLEFDIMQSITIDDDLDTIFNTIANIIE